MNKIALTIILFILITVTAAGCGTDAESQKGNSFGELVLIDEYNSVIELTYVDSHNTGKIGSEISLLLENKADQPVYFPPDHNVKIYYYDAEHKEWIGIQNQITYFAITGDSSDDALDLDPFMPSIIDVLPVIENVEEPITIRVVVTGYQKTQDGQKKYVGAYIDVPLQP